MIGMMTTIRRDFLDFVRVLFPEGRIVKPSNDSLFEASAEAIGIAVSDKCVDVFARVLAGKTPIYVERSYGLGQDGKVLYFAKLYESSDEFGDVFSNYIAETESEDVNEFQASVRSWIGRS